MRRAILSDIEEFKLNPAKPHVVVGANGRLRNVVDVVDIVTENTSVVEKISDSQEEITNNEKLEKKLELDIAELTGTDKMLSNEQHSDESVSPTSGVEEKHVESVVEKAPAPEVKKRRFKKNEIQE